MKVERCQFSGCITAIVTPFNKGRVDYKKLLDLIDFQISNGVTGIVLCGTTGEGPTVIDDEKKRIFKAAVKHNHGRVQMIAGTGTNDTVTTIKRTQMAQKCGMDAALIVTPYYNKPTQQGMFLHFTAVAKKTKLPIILYNVPGRTGVSMAPETVARLSKVKNIVAIKEASGNLKNIARIKNLCGITILSGDDGLTYPILCLGGKGVISVASNIVPADVVRMIDLFNDKNFKEAKNLHLKLQPLFNALFVESNPIPVKTAMKMLGMINDEMRLPLCGMAKPNADKLKTALKNYGI
ncbi:MAG: 4-hydroxy-tetrahydrodipicolinate synthase [Planctomycetes bacterium]|nr:4-hydroxy-tetrahydrodipicolinate synthase [Planctomycetota bacterium]